MTRGLRGAVPGLPRGAHLIALLGAFLLAIGGCECPPGGPGVTYYRMPADSIAHAGTALELPGSARSRHARPAKVAPPPAQVVDKIHPDVQAAILADPSGTATLLVSFQDTLSMEQAKGLDGDALADTLTSLRRTALDADTALVVGHGATVIKRYWLIAALLVEMPLANVPGLSAEPRVVRVEPHRSGAPPSACGSSETTTTYTASAIDATSEFSAYATGRIALFDTGIHEAHALLEGNGLIGNRWSCSISGCVATELQDDLYSWGHGTASAGVLIGGSALGSDLRGMTGARLDSYAVYAGPPDTPTTDLDATIEAFQLAVTASPRYDVFLPVIAVSAGGAGGITQLANRAHDLGILVIAPNGTVGGSEIPSPAVSPRALGIGSYCALTNVFRNGYTIGETPDRRPKPDLTAPTGVYTAALDPNDPSNEAKLREYLGTSCSAPVAAGAALMLRNWLAATSGAVDPGAVYTLLHACTETYGADPEEGSGRLRLPSTGTVFWGVLPLKNGERWRIPIQVADGVEAKVSAAIWWPEYGDGGTGIPADTYRDDFDLYLLDETESVREQSSSYTSVFERVETGGVQGTTWKLEVVGYRVLEESKDIFWVIWVKD